MNILSGHFLDLEECFCVSGEGLVWEEEAVFAGRLFSQEESVLAVREDLDMKPDLECRDKEGFVLGEVLAEHFEHDFLGVCPYSEFDQAWVFPNAAFRI